MESGDSNYFKETEMLGRHQQTSCKERTLVTQEWKKLRVWHQSEKRRLKRAMNKRFRRDGKFELTGSLS